MWRKTITSGAGTYSLGTVQEGLHYIKWANNSATSDSSGTFEYGSEITVNNDGTITGIKNPSTITVKPWDDDASKANVFKGKFIKMISQVETSMSSFEIGEIWWIPADAVMTKDLLNGESNRWYIAASKRQQVIGIPAGTTTTYPVSTNPKAYQEGSDAKPAGYTLGDATNGVVISDMSGTADFEITTGTAVNVSNDGAVALGGSVTTLSSTYKLSKIVSDLKTYGSGKFCSIVCTYNKQYTSGKFLSGIWYIPSDATMSVDTTITGAAVNLSVVGAKPVTGYSAIPAGTTIEYLGKLGDKARVQVLSYVGTGTYGSSNPNSITLDFVPKLFWISGLGYGYEAEMLVFYGDTKKSEGNSDYYFTFDNISWEGKKVSWYSTRNAELQANSSGAKYIIHAIG